ncbi:BT4734/BF3469 family protein [Marseilla massiliensis]|uniref:Virulence protein E n=1 Tax=Marseilla massiliensis TaxID=1841864 RepID=A0A939B6U8_9BACT|nr:BT4734/BF3469 family protein [Marseilla massiliensis]MBM6674649.1 virulence protein E [Marseilla massiliensis]
MKTMQQVTLTQRINYTKFNLGYATVDDVVKIIREGNIFMNDYKYGQYTLKQAVEYIRSLNTHAEQQQWKERLLPAVAYNGVFSEVEESHIMQYSNVTAMDFDDIEGYNEMQHLWRRLIITPCVYSVFVTPSGGRLKALVLHDNTNPNNHRDLYEQLLAKFNISNPDTSCRDLARRNYLSYDPNIWVNPNPVPYHYVPTIKPVNKVQQVRQVQPKNHYAQTGKKISDRSIISIMNSNCKKNHPEYWQEGHRACSIFKLACLFCKWGVEEDLALEYFITGWESETMTEDEITGHVTNAYKTEKDNFGTVDFTFYK